MMKMKKNTKWMTMTLCAAMICLALAGCMNSNAEVTPNAEPSGQPDMSMQPDMIFGATTDPNASASPIAQAFDWLMNGPGVEDRINMLSEIQDSRIIVNGNTALVGVKFASQYQGEMTQRIRDMVAGEVQAADANIQAVAVTAEEADVQKIDEMADQIATGTPVSELESEIDAIVRNVTTIQ